MQSESVNQWLDVDQVRALAETLMRPGTAEPPVTSDAIFGSNFIGFAEFEISPAQVPFVRQKGIAPSVSPPGKMPVASVPLQPPLAQVPVSKPAEEIEVTLTETHNLTMPKPAESLVSTHPIVRFKSPFKIAIAPVELTSQVDPKTPESRKAIPLFARLSTFGDWLRAKIPAESFFICDRNGEVVVDEIGSEKLIKVARTLAHASSNAGRQVGSEQDPVSLHVKVGPDRVMEVIPRHSHFGLVILGIIVPRPLSRESVASVAHALDAALAEPGASTPG